MNRLCLELFHMTEGHESLPCNVGHIEGHLRIDGDCVGASNLAGLPPFSAENRKNFTGLAIKDAHVSTQTCSGENVLLVLIR